MTDELEQIAMIPDEWLAPSATGTPTELAPIVDAYTDAILVAGDAPLRLH